MQCQVCKRNFETRRGLSYHLKSHNLSYKEYYDTYLKKPNEGICIICSKPTSFIGDKYKECCSYKCTCLLRYGVDHNSKIPEIKIKMHTAEAHEKQKRTCIEKYNGLGFGSSKIREKVNKSKLEHYGNQNYNNREKAAKTNLNKIGKKSYLELSEVHNKGIIASKTQKTKDKIKATNLKRYNVSCPLQKEEVRQKAQTDLAKQKRHDTKLMNGWLQNKIEELFKQKLIELKIDYLHNYKSDLYPYSCDFYLPKFDLYIEINCYWTHGSHFYTDNEIDKNMVNFYKDKNNDAYRKAIYTWTVSDITKRNCAIKNNLNYVVLWNKQQINQFLDSILETTYKGFVDFNDFT